MPLTQVSPGLLDSNAQYYGMKNRLINGGMVIDQRNNGASVTIPATTVQYTVDRWFLFATQASKVTVQQNAGSVTPPTGFSNYAGLTVGASANVTVGSSDQFAFQQRIEGFNISDLAWGTANAAPVTLSFWVRSSLTGTFGGALNNTGAPSYPFTYTINAANTWELKTISIAGPTIGTWATNNATSISVIFSIGAGSTQVGTAGAWVNSSFVSATGATNLIATNSATFYITGVQLEKGSTATSFEFRDYGRELAMCQRYTFVINSVENANFDHVALGVAASTTNFRGVFYFPVTMRSIPSYTATASDFNIDWSAGGITCTSTSIDRAQTYGASINFNVASGFTANGASRVIRNNTTSPARLIFSSEL
jgi:hypothetical protein